MTNTLTQQDFCQHEPRCPPRGWLECTVPNYMTYSQAFRWLREYRSQTRIFVRNEIVNGKRTRGFVFRFRCEQEYILFALKWGGINGRQ